jgi:NAD+ diphosphatase
MPLDPFSAPLTIEGMGFTGRWLDRADTYRQDSAKVDAMRRDPASRWLLLQDLKPVMDLRGGALDLLWLPPDMVPPDAPWVFLGLQGEIPHFAAAVDKAMIVPGKAIDARAVGAQLDGDKGGVVAQARALLSWHDKHQHCAVCGSPTLVRKAGYARQCGNDACKAEHFPRTDPVVIMLVVDGERCLLGRQPQFPAGFYSALAGFVEPGESLEEAVRREVAEEAGIQAGRVRYVASQPWPFPSSLMIGAFAEALSDSIRIDTTELEDARWFTRADARAALAGKGPFVVPPPLAIAHHLLKAWVRLGD